MIIRFIFYVCVIYLTIGCKTNILELNPEKATFRLKKGEGIGKFPVFNLDVYNNGVVVYEGIRDAEMYGIYSKKISKDEFKALEKEYIKANFLSLDGEYRSSNNVTPLVSMSFKKGKQIKTIKGKSERPEEVKSLQAMLEKLISGKNWQLIKEYPKNVFVDDISEEEKTIQRQELRESEIIIEPSANIFMSVWLKKYNQYGVQLVKRISPNLNLWVIAYSQTKISGKELMEVIKNDKDIKSVQFNSEISPR